MNDLSQYIIEKLHLNKELEVDTKENNNAEVFYNFFYHMMKDMQWYDNEYKIDAENDFVTIKFIITPKQKDFSDTLDGILNRLKDRKMEDYMIVSYNLSKKEIYIKIDIEQKYKH